MSDISVLVIDDDGESRELTAELIRDAGYSVRTAANGHEGLQVLAETRPAVIFLDVHMPIMDGPHFRAAQRQDPELLEIPTIVMTGDANENPLLDLAIAETRRKPLRKADILILVERYCGAA